MQFLDLSPSEIQALLHKCFPDVPDLMDKVKFDVKPLGDGRSFWSHIAKVNLEWSEELEDEMPASVFVKIPIISSNVPEQETMTDDMLFENLLAFTANEIEFYRLFKEPIQDFPRPKLYHADDMTRSKAGALVLEDLSDRAAAIEHLPGFSLKQVENLMLAFASFHHHCITSPKRWQDKFPFPVDQRFQTLQWDTAMNLLDMQPETFKGKLEKLEGFFSVEHAEKSINSFKEFGIPPVLVHMDLNVTNVLWKKGSDGKATDDILAIIDFQQMHTGNICEDFCRIFMLGLSCEQRRKLTKPLLQKYHDRLTELFDGNPPYTLETVYACYDYMFPYVSNFALFALVLYTQMAGGSEKCPEKLKATQDEFLARAAGIVDELVERI